MKAILIILVVALAGLSYKFQLDAKSAKAKMIAAEDAAHKSESLREDAESELLEAQAKIANLEADLATAKTEANEAKDRMATAELDFSKRLTETKPKETEVKSAAEVVAGIEAKREAEIALLNEQYNKALIQVADQRAVLAANQEKAKLAFEVLKKNAPSFAEQRNDNTDGRRVGIRTSQADREEVLAKYQADLEAMTNAIANMKGEAIALDAREKAVKDRYQSELRRIQN